MLTASGDYRGLRRPPRGRHSDHICLRPFRANHLLPLPRQLPVSEASDRSVSLTPSSSSASSPLAYVGYTLVGEAGIVDLAHSFLVDAR